VRTGTVAIGRLPEPAEAEAALAGKPGAD